MSGSCGELNIFGHPCERVPDHDGYHTTTGPSSCTWTSPPAAAEFDWGDPQPPVIVHAPAEMVAKIQHHRRTEQYVVNFDYRSDSGPRLVGPFDTREQGDAYVRGLHLDGAEYSVSPLAAPESPATERSTP